jgi:hypothetical protein
LQGGQLKKTSNRVWSVIALYERGGRRFTQKDETDRSVPATAYRGLILFMPAAESRDILRGGFAVQ